MELEKLDLSVRTFNVLCRAGIKTAEELRERFYHDGALMNAVGAKGRREIEDVLIKPMQQKPAEVVVSVSNDYTQAISLTRRIAANAQAMQQSLYEVCIGLMEMRGRKLYKELGYQNFADYCEQELEIRRHQAYKYADIGVMLKEKNVESTQHFENLGAEKLYLLAKLDEPTRQELTQTVNVESVTVKELQAHIKELETENAENEHAAELLSAELDEAKQSLEKKDKQFRAAMDSKQGELDTFRADAKRRQDMLITKITKLNEQIAELENRPIEHDVVDNSDELEQLRADLAAARQQLADRPVQEALPTETYTDERKEFNAYLRVADEAVGQVFKCLCRQGKDSQKTLGGIAIRTLEKYNTLFSFEEE